jgi:hypothetical protein
MNLNAKLAIAKQAFDELLTLCAPEDVESWKPSPEQRAKYVQLAKSAVDGMLQLQHSERSKLFAEVDALVTVLPSSLLSFVRESLGPRTPALQTALAHLDPDGEIVRRCFAELDGFGGTKGLLLSTFYEGIEQVVQLQERNPDRDFSFLPTMASQFLESPLIDFKPDDWLDRVNEIAPLRTHRKNFNPPVQVRLRLQELYRAYVFGLWLSVFGLARAILEYAVRDNLSKFGIDPQWSNGPEKKLSHLLEELQPHLPNLTTAMAHVRDHGNEYLHPDPKTKRGSSPSLFERREAARVVVAHLIEAVEGLYLAERSSNEAPSVRR